MSDNLSSELLEVEALAGTELHISDDISSEEEDDKKIIECLFRNYFRMHDLVMPYALRCYECAEALYLVFKPFDNKYDFHFDGMDHVRKYVQSHCSPLMMIITREILAKKVHYNVFLWRCYDGYDFHQKQTSRYRVHQQIMFNLTDRKNVLNYMIKESKERRFNKKIDYIIRP